MKKKILVIFSVLLISVLSIAQDQMPKVGERHIPFIQKYSDNLKVDFNHPVKELPGQNKNNLYPIKLNNETKGKTSFFMPSFISVDNGKIEHHYTYNSKGELITVLTKLNNSGLLIDSLKYTYTYDNNSNLLTVVGELWLNNLWTKTTRNSFTYDSNNKVLTNTWELWSGSSWVPLSKTTFTYDTQGNTLTAMNEAWINGTLIERIRFTYTYDANNNMLTETNELWQDNAWLNIANIIYTYNPENKPITELWQVWLNGAWSDVNRFTLSYDSNGLLTMILQETKVNNAWTDFSRTKFTYDANGNTLSRVVEKWVVALWVNFARDVYEYDIDGNMILNLVQTWAIIQWKNEFQFLYKYENNLRTEAINQRWVNNDWMNELRVTNGYDGNGNCITGSFYEWSNNQWNLTTGPIPVSYNYNMQMLYVIGKTITVQYTSPTDLNDNAGVVETFSLEQNYPNPFNPSTVIKFSLPAAGVTTIKVYDITGSETATILNGYLDAGTHEVNFNAAGLAAGVYFYKLTSGTFSGVKKLIILK